MCRHVRGHPQIRGFPQHQSAGAPCLIPQRMKCLWHRFLDPTSASSISALQNGCTVSCYYVWSRRCRTSHTAPIEDSRGPGQYLAVLFGAAGVGWVGGCIPGSQGSLGVAGPPAGRPPGPQRPGANFDAFKITPIRPDFVQANASTLSRCQVKVVANGLSTSGG